MYLQCDKSHYCNSPLFIAVSVEYSTNNFSRSYARKTKGLSFREHTVEGVVQWCVVCAMLSVVHSFSSSGHHLSSVVCLEDKSEGYDCSVLCTVLQLCTVICTHTHTHTRAVLTYGCWLKYRLICFFAPFSNLRPVCARTSFFLLFDYFLLVFVSLVSLPVHLIAIAWTDLSLIWPVIMCQVDR